MTGNVVFVGFAAAGARGFSLTASLSALAGFLLGALGGGLVTDRRDGNRTKLFRDTVAVEALLLAAVLIISLATQDSGGATKDGIAGVAAVALGLQNSLARRLA